MIAININLSKIPKDKIFVGKTGEKYLSLVVDERKEVDKFGNTHTVYLSQSKDEREAKTDKVYLGSGKLYSFEKKAVSESQPTKSNTPFTDTIEDDESGLPF